AKSRTSGCARGLKTHSHTSSVPRRGFRDRARRLGGKDTLTRADQLAGIVQLVPDVPEEHSARLAVLDVGDIALAVRLLPVLDDLESRVDDPDRLVAEVEQVGVEEGEVQVRTVSSGHVRADGPPVTVRVILVLDPQRDPESGNRETGDVPCSKDVVVTGDAPV